MNIITLYAHRKNTFILKLFKEHIICIYKENLDF